MTSPCQQAQCNSICYPFTSNYRKPRRDQIAFAQLLCLGVSSSVRVSMQCSAQELGSESARARSSPAKDSTHSVLAA